LAVRYWEWIWRLCFNLASVDADHRSSTAVCHPWAIWGSSIPNTDSVAVSHTYTNSLSHTDTSAHAVAFAITISLSDTNANSVTISHTHPTPYTYPDINTHTISYTYTYNYSNTLSDTNNSFSFSQTNNKRQPIARPNSGRITDPGPVARQRSGTVGLLLFVCIHLMRAGGQHVKR